MKEAPPGFEPGMADLQSAALAAWLRRQMPKSDVRLPLDDDPGQSGYTQHRVLTTKDLPLFTVETQEYQDENDEQAQQVTHAVSANMAPARATVQENSRKNALF